MIRHRKGQFFLIVAVFYCIILLSIASYVIAVISSPPSAMIQGDQYAYTNIKSQCIRVVQVSLANFTNGGSSNILYLNLKNWNYSTQNFFAKEGFSLYLSYTSFGMKENWNQSYSWSKANASFTMILQSESSQMMDIFTVKSELYANITQVTSWNTTYSCVYVKVWKEASAPVVSATVNVNVNSTSVQATNNGNGIYVAIVHHSSSPYIVKVWDSRSIFVQAKT